MDFFGKKLDENTVNKLKEIINSPQGQKLKEELRNTDVKDLAEKLKGMDLSGVDMKDISEKIDSQDKNELIRKLKEVNDRMFRKGR